MLFHAVMIADIAQNFFDRRMQIERRCFRFGRCLWWASALRRFNGLWGYLLNLSLSIRRDVVESDGVKIKNRR